MSRIGKIARLPHSIRHQINLRLEDGEGGQKLLKWINALPEVQSILAKDSASIPITDGNLSEWRKSGYTDWLRIQSKCDAVRRLNEEAHVLNLAGGPRTHPCHNLSSLLTAEFAELASLLLSEKTDPAERFKVLSGVLRELTQLRKADCRAEQLRIQGERWDIEQERLIEENIERKLAREKAAATAPLRARLAQDQLSNDNGGGDDAWNLAAQVLEIAHDVKPGTLPRKAPRSPPNPLESDHSKVGQPVAISSEIPPQRSDAGSPQTPLDPCRTAACRAVTSGEDGGAAGPPDELGESRPSTTDPGGATAEVLPSEAPDDVYPSQPRVPRRLSEWGPLLGPPLPPIPVPMPDNPAESD